MDEIKTTEDYYKMLNSCYFHPSRKYPSEAVKIRSRMAMTMLWQVSEINISCMKFIQIDIRRILVDEMMPEDLDRAIEYASKADVEMQFSEFALLIFMCVLFGDAITQTEFDLTYGKSFTTKITIESEETLTK